MKTSRRGAIHRARKAARLPHYDYSQPGAYFITACVQGRACLLGNMHDDGVILSDAGKAVAAVWQVLPQRFSVIKHDEFVVMPNHVHGIIHIVGAPFMAPTPQGAMNRAPTLGEVIRSFKAASTRAIRQQGVSSFAWQRNYYEHVIRNDRELNLVREYIANNPLQWMLDRENPAATGRLAVQEFAEVFGMELP